MKKKFVFLYLFITSCFSYSHEINWSPYLIEDNDISILYSDNYTYVWFYENCDWIKIFKNNKIEENGFIIINDFINHQTDLLFVIEGKNIILLEQYYFPWDRDTGTHKEISVYDSPVISRDISLSEWHDRKYNRTENHITKEGWNRITLYEDGIKNITASSFLEEKNRDGTSVVYSAENIKDTLFYLTGDGTVDLLYDNLTPPWVEGVEGYGVGEYLDIEFDYASDEIQILNGFVDFSRMHLYKDNSRVKRIRIDSENPSFSQEYELEDLVKYNVLTLPQPTDKIRMTILDVYPGRRWQDTCISSILVTDPDQTPYEEQKEKIITLMKENGVQDQIEEFKRENGL